MRDSLLLGLVGSCQKGPCVAGTELTFNDESLHRTRQLEQPDRIGNRRARTTDPGRNLLLSEAEVLDELLVRRRLLKRVEVLAMKVLDNCSFERSEVIGISNDGGNRRQIGPTSRSPPPLPCNEFIPLVGGPHHDRLDNPDLGNRSSQ